MSASKKKDSEEEKLEYVHRISTEICSVQCNLKDSLASRLKPKEMIRSSNVESMVLCISSETSYREACNILNHFYHIDGEDCILPNTLSDHISSVGIKMQMEMDQLSSEILPENGFTTTGSASEAPSSFKQEIPDEQENPSELFG